MEIIPLIYTVNARSTVRRYSEQVMNRVNSPGGVVTFKKSWITRLLAYTAFIALVYCTLAFNYPDVFGWSIGAGSRAGDRFVFLAIGFLFAYLALSCAGPSELILDTRSRTYSYRNGPPYRVTTQRGTFDDFEGIQAVYTELRHNQGQCLICLVWRPSKGKKRRSLEFVVDLKAVPSRLQAYSEQFGLPIIG